MVGYLLSRLPPQRRGVDHYLALVAAVLTGHVLILRDDEQAVDHVIDYDFWSGSPFVGMSKPPKISHAGSMAR